jgi:hypothetical protein
MRGLCKEQLFTVPTRLEFERSLIVYPQHLEHLLCVDQVMSVTLGIVVDLHKVRRVL